MFCACLSLWVTTERIDSFSNSWFVINPKRRKVRRDNNLCKLSDRMVLYLSAGFSFFNGGSATFLSAPVGVQLNRQLNNNLIAFAGISVAPTFYSFSNTFTNPAYNKSYPGMMGYNPYTFGMNSRVEMGLMYINDAKTFSISGSIGIERYDYPVYPHPPPERTNSKRP